MFRGVKVLPLALILLPACADEDEEGSGDGATDTAAQEGSGTAGGTGASQEDVLARFDHPCDDALDAIYDASAPESWDASMRGTIAGCRYDRVIEVEEMSALMSQYSHPDPGFSTRVHKLLISYWTERNEGEPVLTSGALYYPEIPRAEPAPLLVAGHGSVGLADKCAPSLDDPEGFEKDWKTSTYTFAGDGWVVLMPDYPGLGTPGATTWMLSSDEGHSMLDATRAARNLAVDGTFSSRNALLGHSNGGHAALSAQAMLAGYGAEGTVEATVLYSPFWISNATWGALTTPAGVAFLDSTFMSLVLQYFYGHALAYDGPDGPAAIFAEDKHDAIVELLEGECWSNVVSDELGPPSLGIESGADAFTAEFVDEVGNCGLLDSCESEAAMTWRERWVADRPGLTAGPPVVHWMGSADDFLTPGFQQCGIDRVVGQGVTTTICVDDGGGHSDLIAREAAWVRQYFAHVLLDEEAPEACPGLEVFEDEPFCNLPIANSTDPADP